MNTKQTFWTFWCVPVCHLLQCRRCSFQTQWGHRPLGTDPYWRQWEDRFSHTHHPQLSPTSSWLRPSTKENTLWLVYVKAWDIKLWRTKFKQGREEWNHKWREQRGEREKKRWPQSVFEPHPLLFPGLCPPCVWSEKQHGTEVTRSWRAGGLDIPQPLYTEAHGSAYRGCNDHIS